MDNDAIRHEMQAEIAALRKVLRSLSNEAAGLWSAYEYDLRQAMGHTNYQVMLDKIGEARAVLGLTPQTGDDNGS